MANKPKPPKETISIKIEDADIKAILRTFKRMDQIASKDLRDLSTELAQEIATAIQAAASFAEARGGNSRQAVAVTDTIKVNRDRVPSITIGGSKSVTSSGAKAGNLLFGAEFGASKFKQFPRRSPKDGRGNAGYFIFPTLKMMQPRIRDKWVQGVDKIREEWRGRIGSG
jgi:hypothetical protein